MHTTTCLTMIRSVNGPVRSSFTVCMLSTSTQNTALHSASSLCTSVCYVLKLRFPFNGSLAEHLGSLYDFLLPTAPVIFGAAASLQLEVLDPMQTLKKQERTIRDLKQVHRYLVDSEGIHASAANKMANLASG